MEEYPREFVTHLAPLVVVSGIVDPSSRNAEGGYDTILGSHPLAAQGEVPASYDMKDANTNLAIDLRIRLAAKGRELTQWEHQAVNIGTKQANHLVHIQFTARSDFKFLPIKKVVYTSDRAPPPVTQGPRLDFVRKYNNGDLHSSISPRNVNSELFPDGVLGVEWLQKYLYLLPCTFVSVHELGRGLKEDDELIRILEELKVQVEIRGIKLIVILLIEGEVNDSINDRIYNIRRSTGLAARTGLFVLPDKSQVVERETLVETICQLAFSQGLEFAMTISKNLRKKRGKNNVLNDEIDKLHIPPLSNVGWEVRYNFKLAAMSEYRQELEVALTLYETAYDSMIELFETLNIEVGSGSGGTNGDLPSPHDINRWCEGRLLLDIIAFKIIKLCLLTEQTNIAYRKFLIHLETVTTIIKKKGLSEDKFSYINWKSRQYEKIADMIIDGGDDLMEVIISKNKNKNKGSTNMIGSAKAFDPIFQLPEPGYLYLESFNLLRKLSNDKEIIRDEDPYFSGDFDYFQNSANLLNKALERFKGNIRSRALIYSHLGDLYLLKKDYKLSLSNYKKAANIYRKDNWNELFVKQLEGIIESSKEVSDVDNIAAKFEKLVVREGGKDNREGDDNTYNIFSESLTPQPIFQLGRREEIKPFSSLFVFEKPSCFTGVGINFQLTINPLFQSPSSLKIYRIQIFFKGERGDLDKNPIVILNDDSLPNKIFTLPIKDEKEPTSFHSNLTFTKQTPKIFQLHLTPNQLGDVEFDKILVDIKYPKFEFQQQIKQENDKLTPVISWASGPPQQHGDLHAGQHLHPTFKHIRINNPPYITRVQPRPSQIYITSNSPQSAFSGETLTLNISVENRETESILLKVDGNASVDNGESIPIEWIDKPKDYQDEISSNTTSIHSISLHIPNTGTTNIVLELSVSYYLLSDDEKSTLIKDAALVSIPVTKPFRVNFDVAPRVHEEEWDNTFIPGVTIGSGPIDNPPTHSNATSAAANTPSSPIPTSPNPSISALNTTTSNSPIIRKRWELLALILYLNEESISIVDSTLEISTTSNDVGCEIISRTPSTPSELAISHNDSIKHNFTFDCFRISAQDIRTVPAEAHLTIKWKHNNSSTIHSFLVSPVRLHLPLYEPRVILSITPINITPPPITLNASYYIENATSHILTYSVSMASTADFSWQGAKRISIRLLPFTRRHLSYTLIRVRTDPTQSNLLSLPSLKVYDTFYKRVLPVLPASSNIRSDKSNLLLDINTLTTK